MQWLSAKAPRMIGIHHDSARRTRQGFNFAFLDGWGRFTVMGGVLPKETLSIILNLGINFIVLLVLSKQTNSLA